MKTYKIIIAAALASLTFVSCDQSLLDIDQKGVLAEDNFYKTDEDCTAALAGAYAAIQHPVESKFFTYLYTVLSQVSDEVYTCDAGYKVDDSHSFMFYSYDNTNKYIRAPYRSFFSIIYRCNLVIDNFKNGTSPVQKNAVAEAKVIRSWAYIYLTSMFNTPPIVDHALKTNAEFRQPNADPKDLWAFIINSLDEAINSGALSSKSDAHDKTAVRATREFALALKGKAQVYSGDYAGAKATLKQVIDSKKYELIPSDQLQDLFFTSKGNWNCEVLFQNNVNSTSENYKAVGTSDQWSAYNVVRIDKFQIKEGSYLKEYGAGWNHYTPTEKFLKAFIANDGINSYRFKAWLYSYEELQDMGLVEFSTLRDDSQRSYLASTSMSTPDPKCPYGYAANYCAETNGFWQRKLTMVPEDIYDMGYSYDKVGRRWMRYAEVLLLYAEACAQLGETSGDGLVALNSIALRAGAPTYDKLSLANVKNEKWFEMWGELTRFFDLVRWGDAEKELSGHYNTLPVFFGYKDGKSAADIKPDGSNLFDVYEIRYFDVASYTGSKYNFVKGKNEHLPFPNTEIANNPELVQNPGY